MKDRPIIIAGGGIAGLSAALALQGENEIQVFEKSRQLNEAGAGIQIGPNAVRALKAIGAWEAVKEITSSPEEITVRHGGSGRVLQRIKLGTEFEQRFGQPYRVCRRADLHAALLATAKDRKRINIQHDAEVSSTVADGAVINGNTIAGQCVIAADGIHSRLRQQMNPASAPVELNLTMFRAVSKGTTENNVTLWLCSGAHLVHYAVGAEANLNLVAVFDGGVASPATGFANCHTELADLIANITNWQSWPVLHTPHLPRWHDSTTCLIGDAAHGTVPFLAQGAAMAFEDAAALGNLRGPWIDRFQHYEKQRRARTQKLDHQSRRMARIYHMTGFIAAIRDTMMSLSPSSLALNNIAWIYNG